MNLQESMDSGGLASHGSPGDFLALAKPPSLRRKEATPRDLAQSSSLESSADMYGASRLKKRVCPPPPPPPPPGPQSSTSVTSMGLKFGISKWRLGTKTVTVIFEGKILIMPRYSRPLNFLWVPISNSRYTVVIKKFDRHTSILNIF